MEEMASTHLQQGAHQVLVEQNMPIVKYKEFPYHIVRNDGRVPGGPAYLLQPATPAEFDAVIVQIQHQRQAEQAGRQATERFGPMLRRLEALVGAVEGVRDAVLPNRPSPAGAASFSSSSSSGGAPPQRKVATRTALVALADALDGLRTALPTAPDAVPAEASYAPSRVRWTDDGAGTPDTLPSEVQAPSEAESALGQRVEDLSHPSDPVAAAVKAAYERAEAWSSAVDAWAKALSEATAGRASGTAAPAAGAAVLEAEHPSDAVRAAASASLLAPYSLTASIPAAAAVAHFAPGPGALEDPPAPRDPETDGSIGRLLSAAACGRPLTAGAVLADLYAAAGRAAVKAMSGTGPYKPPLRGVESSLSGPDYLLFEVKSKRNTMDKQITKLQQQRDASVRSFQKQIAAIDTGGVAPANPARPYPLGLRGPGEGLAAAVTAGTADVSSASLSEFGPPLWTAGAYREAQSQFPRQVVVSLDAAGGGGPGTLAGAVGGGSAGSELRKASMVLRGIAEDAEAAEAAAAPRGGDRLSRRLEAMSATIPARDETLAVPLGVIAPLVWRRAARGAVINGWQAAAVRMAMAAPLTAHGVRRVPLPGPVAAWTTRDALEERLRRETAAVDAGVKGRWELHRESQREVRAAERAAARKRRVELRQGRREALRRAREARFGRKKRQEGDEHSSSAAASSSSSAAPAESAEKAEGAGDDDEESEESEDDAAGAEEESEEVRAAVADAVQEDRAEAEAEAEALAQSCLTPAAVVEAAGREPAAGCGAPPRGASLQPLARHAYVLALLGAEHVLVLGRWVPAGMPKRCLASRFADAPAAVVDAAWPLYLLCCAALDEGLRASALDLEARLQRGELTDEVQHHAEEEAERRRGEVRQRMQETTAKVDEVIGTLRRGFAQAGRAQVGLPLDEEYRGVMRRRAGLAGAAAAGAEDDATLMWGQALVMAGERSVEALPERDGPKPSPGLAVPLKPPAVMRTRLAERVVVALQRAGTLPLPLSKVEEAALDTAGMSDHQWTDTVSWDRIYGRAAGSDDLGRAWGEAEAGPARAIRAKLFVKATGRASAAAKAGWAPGDVVPCRGAVVVRPSPAELRAQFAAAEGSAGVVRAAVAWAGSSSSPDGVMDSSWASEAASSAVRAGRPGPGAEEAARQVGVAASAPIEAAERGRREAAMGLRPAELGAAPAADASLEEGGTDAPGGVAMAPSSRSGIRLRLRVLPPSSRCLPDDTTLEEIAKLCAVPFHDPSHPPTAGGEPAGQADEAEAGAPRAVAGPALVALLRTGGSVADAIRSAALDRADAELEAAMEAGRPAFSSEAIGAMLEEAGSADAVAAAAASVSKTVEEAAAARRKAAEDAAARGGSRPQRMIGWAYEEEGEDEDEEDEDEDEEGGRANGDGDDEGFEPKPRGRAAARRARRALTSHNDEDEEDGGPAGDEDGAEDDGPPSGGRAGKRRRRWGAGEDDEDYDEGSKRVRA